MIVNGTEVKTGEWKQTNKFGRYLGGKWTILGDWLKDRGMR